MELTQNICRHTASRLSQKVQEQPRYKKGILPRSKEEEAHDEDSLNVGEESFGVNTIKKGFKKTFI